MNWQIKKLEEICDFFSDGNWIESKDQSEEGIRLVQTGNIGEGYFKNRDEKARYISEKTFKKLKCTEIFSGDILISRLPEPVGRSCIIPKTEENKMITAVDCSILRLKKDKIIPKFFNYYSQCEQYLKDINSKTTGTTRKRISRKNLGIISIPLPPLPEQKRLVALLDDVFGKLDLVKENVERNLENTKEVFEAYLSDIFDDNRGWQEKRLGECFKLKSGENLISKNMSPNGKFNVYGGNGIAGQHNKFNLEGNNIIIGRVGALCGIARNITGRIWLTDNAFKIIDLKYNFDNAFLTYLLNFKNLRKSARQAAQPVISNSSLKDLLLQFPKSLHEQKSIVKKLDALSAEVRKLEENYRQKLADIEELKKSVLKKAFNGEL